MKKSGFTLIELLIVVAIIAILAAIAVPNFLEAQVRSKISRGKADMRTLATAVESYIVDHNKPPYGYAQSWFDQLPLPGNTPEIYAQNCDIRWSLWTTPVAYMTSIPEDPFISKGRITSGTKAQYWDTHYQYQSTKNMRINHVKIWNAMGEYNTPCASKNVTWLISSWGPSRKQNPPGLSNDQWGAAAHINYPNENAAGYPNLIYDPSNGTVSFGWLMRTSQGVQN